MQLIHGRLAALAVSAALACSSPTENPIPGSLIVGVLPLSMSVRQGAGASLSVAVTRRGDYNGSVDLTVTGMPPGVTVAVSNLVTSRGVTTATVMIDVAESVPPGIYRLNIHATGTDVREAIGLFDLTVTVRLIPCTSGALCAQWAASAFASSEYTSSDWGAYQAAGEPNVNGCTDDVRAWASTEPNGVDWLELAFADSVQPTEIQIHESYGVSSIVKVEVRDNSGTYHTVYAANAGRQSCPRALVIPVTGISVPVRIVRVSLDQRTIADWNEIDAVKLIGRR